MVRWQETLSGQWSRKDVETIRTKHASVTDNSSFVLFQLDLHESASQHGNKCKICISLITPVKQSKTSQRAFTSVGWLGGVGLRVAPSPHPTLQPEGAALVIEPSPLLKGAEQVVQCIWEVGG